MAVVNVFAGLAAFQGYPTPESHSNHPVAMVMQPISHDGNNGCEDNNSGNVTPTAENQSPSSAVTNERAVPEAAVMPSRQRVEVHEESPCFAAKKPPSSSLRVSINLTVHFVRT